MASGTLQWALTQPLERVLAWYQGRPIRQAEFLSHLARLEGRLRGGSEPLINICEDRYHFLLAYLTGLLAGRTTLLPHNRNELTIEELAVRYPGSIRLDDGLIATWLGADTDFVDAGKVAPKVPGEQVAAVVFTSGSTGVPTAHAKSLQSLEMGSRLLQQRLSRDYGLRVCALAATVPSQHMYGLEATVMLPTLHGYPIHAGRPLFPADVLAVLEALPAPRALITTPVHLKALLDAELVWPELEFVLSSTAPLPAELAQQAEATMKTSLIEIYGSSETGAIATRRQTKEASWRPLDGTEVRMENNAASVVAPHLADSTRLGDVLQIEDDGSFQVLGRDSDMIKIAGKRASLADLTEKLLALPGVKDGIIFLPDESSSRVVRLAALVVAPELEVSTIRQGLAAVVDPVFLPRPIHLVPALPRNDTGKPVRQALLALMKSLEGQR